MITMFFPSAKRIEEDKKEKEKKEKEAQKQAKWGWNVGSPGQNSYAKAAQLGISHDEFLRRDRIVREMWQKTSWTVGSKLWPADKKEAEECGACIVRTVYRDYFSFDSEDARKWPKDDRPLIVTVEPEKGSYRLICCTPNWLQLTCPIKGGCN